MTEAKLALSRRSSLWFAFFANIFARAVRSDFHAVRLSRAAPAPAPATPQLLVYLNHPSWWDAAITIVLLARLFPGRPGHAPIDAAMLKRYGFMARIGAFGVERDSRRGAAVFLATGAEILARPQGLLFVTAQGRFVDARVRPVRLASGLAHLIDRAPDATLVPLAVDYCFWDERQPELLLRFGAPIAARALLVLDRSARQLVLERQLEEAMNGLAEDAIARDASRFTTLLEGSVGVGGVYDLWRRGRAALRGERFSAAHGDQP